jgi:chaperonin GroEL (HSP60 family)
MNTLNDLSVVCGCDLASSLKGDLISSIKFHEAPYVDQVTVFKGRTVVANTPTHGHVAAHLANLRSRRENEQVDDKGKLFDKRIKSLSPNHVIIRLPDDKDFVTRSQAIDNALRAVKSAVDFGITETGDLVATELASRVHADRCVKTLLEMGAYLEN